ncbi:MAG: hypothetical protein J7501_01060 [Bdellovibrio sp.]|nr:hypothetical protein [Bdellovibrio sp.]
MKWGRIGLSVLMALQLQVAAAQNKNNSVKSGDGVDTGLFPIDVAPTNGDPIDKLFPTQPKIGIQPPAGNAPSAPNVTPAPSTQAPVAGSGNSSGLPVTIKPTTDAASAKFKCDLFTNNDYSDILAAANALNQAVSSPSCNGSTLSAQSVIDNNKKITDAIASIQPYLDTPENVKPEDVPKIVSTVDSAIRAANTLATTFANTDLMKSTCRDQMSGGQIALAINDMINGLTPYALMAASMTGGTAAVPFIVGGSVITSAISSMSKIVTENSTKIQDPSVRRAVLENTCQYIRLDQKYKFIMRSRDEQILKLSNAMKSARNLMSVKYSGVSNSTNSLMSRNSALNQTSVVVEGNLKSADPQLASDKQFVLGTSDDVKICQFGIQLAADSQDNTTYVSIMLSSVDQALAVYGSTKVPQARALKASADIAISSLNKMATTRFNFNSDFSPCARAAKSLLETVEQSASLSRQLLKMARANLDKELKNSPEFQKIQASLVAEQQQKQQAARISNSLDNLRNYASHFSQSEIDAEMDRLRSGLFANRTLGISSPVLAWFNYTVGLHKAAISKFKEGVVSLQNRAYKMTKAGSTPPAYYGSQATLTAEQIKADRASAANLETFVPSLLKEDSRAYVDTCREISDVWNRYVTAIDHLAAVESFCQMIDGYIYDNRSEDSALVQMCRGGQTNIGVGNFQSDLGAMKANIIREKSNAWAALIKKRINALGCQGSTDLL